MRILNRYKETITDGPGLRYSIYLAGCIHACPGCHNPESWDPMGGLLFDEYILKEIIDEINSNPMLDGITISGGDPFYDPYALAELCQILKQETGKHILVYTGYTIERLIASERLSAPLPYIDTLIDGPYIASLRDPSILFRGSSNQRIINVKRYLQEHPLPDIV